MTATLFYDLYQRPGHVVRTDPRSGTSVGSLHGVDAVYGGQARFAGVVRVITTPAPSRRVRLHLRQTGVLVRETWSGPDGSFEFRNIAVAEYYAVAFDQNGGFDPAITPIVTPSLAP